MFCINPSCHAEVSDETLRSCPECGTGVLLCDRFILVRPLRPFNPTLTHSVFLAFDRQKQKERVIKVLDYPTEETLRHFEREAGILGNLRHPGIPIVDLDDEGFFSTFTTSKQYLEVYCLVMEKIDGVDLSQFIKKHGSISERRALEWFQQVIEILHYLHQQGIFHRDIKPSNLFLRPDGKIVIIDFGAVREMTDTYLCKIGRGPSPITRINEITIINSVSYSPFEQTQGKAVLQSDFYAIGRTFVYLVTGLSPLSFSEHSGQLDWRMSAHHISPPFADLLNRMMSLMPVDRPRDTQDILVILQRLPGQIKREKRLRSPWAKLAKALVIAVGFLIFLKGATWYFAEKYFSYALEAALDGKLYKAESHLESAISSNPNNPKFYVNLALIRQRIGTRDSKQSAIQCYEQALKLNPWDSAEIRYSLGNLYEQLGDREQAKAQFSRILNQDKTVSSARNSLVRLLILEEQYDAAEQLIQPALFFQLQGRDVRSTLLKNLGWLQYKKGQYSQSSQSLNEAMNLNESVSTDANCLLAQVHDASPKLGASSPYWHLCLSGAGSTPEVQSWRSQKLKQLLEPEIKSSSLSLPKRLR